MKKLLFLPFLCLFLVTGCADDDKKINLAAKNLQNVSYGVDSEQLIDIYLPEGRTEDTKVILLLHGGFWSSGDKNDMANLIPAIKQQFPKHAIVNINYRLASNTSPAFPKQIEDIQKVIQHLETGKYNISDDYAIIGISSGGHLAMLYSYAYDTDHDVKAVCNIVGPADFNDPAYLQNPLFAPALQLLIGTATPTQEQILSISPVAHITAQSSPTITFYGGQDSLIPASQGYLLMNALDSANVYNEFNYYPEGGHGDWNNPTMQEVFGKIILFLKARL